MDKIVIVDYGCGNMRSVVKACQRIGSQVIVSSDRNEIEQADKIILPGVGHFKNGMTKLESYGLVEILNYKVLDRKIPILGICLGMQLFTQHSEEGSVNGLGWLNARTIKMITENEKLKVPHIGWNSVKILKYNTLISNSDDDAGFYFVHSYHVVCSDFSDVLSTTQYGIEFVSGVLKDNILGVQFHPEKSHKIGLKLLQNFINS